MTEISSLSVLMSKIQAVLGLVIAAYKEINFHQKKKKALGGVYCIKTLSLKLGIFFLLGTS